MFPKSRVSSPTLRSISLLLFALGISPRSAFGAAGMAPAEWQRLPPQSQASVAISELLTLYYDEPTDEMFESAVDRFAARMSALQDDTVRRASICYMVHRSCRFEPCSRGYLLSAVIEGAWINKHIDDLDLLRTSIMGEILQMVARERVQLELPPARLQKGHEHESTLDKDDVEAFSLDQFEVLVRSYFDTTPLRRDALRSFDIVLYSSPPEGEAIRYLTTKADGIINLYRLQSLAKLDGEPTEDRLSDYDHIDTVTHRTADEQVIETLTNKVTELEKYPALYLGIFQAQQEQIKPLGNNVKGIQTNLDVITNELKDLNDRVKNLESRDDDWWDDFGGAIGSGLDALSPVAITKAAFRQATHASRLLAQGEDDIIRAIAATVTGDFDKAARYGMHLLGDAVDVVMIPVSIGGDAITTFYEVLPITRPLADLMTQEPPVLRQGPIHGEFGGTPIWYVNGVNTSYNEAAGEAKMAAEVLKRPVFLIYDDGDPLAKGVLIKGGQLLGKLLPGVSAAAKPARQVAWLVLHKGSRRLNLLTFSGGVLTASAAFSIANELGYGDRVRDNVVWMAMGFPIPESLVQPLPRRFYIEPSSGDVVQNFLGFQGYRTLFDDTNRSGHNAKRYINALKTVHVFD